MILQEAAQEEIQPLLISQRNTINTNTHIHIYICNDIKRDDYLLSIITNCN